MNFLLTTDNNFKCHAATTIASILTHNPGATIHLLHSGLSEVDLSKFDHFTQSLRGAFQHYNIIPEKTNWMLFDKHASAANYFRLQAPYIIPQSVDRLVYLDCDVIVRRPLQELFSLDLRGFPLAAIWNPMQEVEIAHLDMPSFKYFNSGVLVISLAEWRSSDLPEKLHSYIRSRNGHLTYWDQDALNGVLNGNWLRLPVSYNAQHSFFLNPPLASAYAHELFNPHVVHFSGNGLKPWQASLTRHPFKKEYRKYRSLTPWPRFQMEGAPNFPRRALSAGKKIARHVPGSRQLYNRIMGQLGLAPKQLQTEANHRDELASSTAHTLFGEHPAVAAGPFAGMRYTAQANGSQLLPKLAGTYEAALHSALNDWIARRCWTNIVNVGCAEGYYAVGLALRLPDAKVHAFDSSSNAQQMCRETIAINNAGHQVIVGGECDHERLSDICSPGTFVVCDIEGGEFDLLDPQRVPELLHCDLLIESHDFIRPGITDALIERFRETHRIVVTTDTPTRPRWKALGLDKKFPHLSPEEISFVLDEQRPGGMKWIWMESGAAE